MPRLFEPYQEKFSSLSFYNLYQPIIKILAHTPVLESRGDRPLKMTFEDQLKSLIFFHLEEHVSGSHLVQVLKEDDFARENIAPKDGIGKSSFFCIFRMIPATDSDRFRPVIPDEVGHRFRRKSAGDSD